MRKTAFSVILALVFIYPLHSQTKSLFEKFSPLLGEWTADSGAASTPGSSYFSFAVSLNGNILIRNNHAELPSDKNLRPAVHDDLLIIYPEGGNETFKAIYFDNEGHVINYNVSINGDNIVFLSDKKTGAPVFRLTYRLQPEKSADIIFEISMDGSSFRTYLRGKAHKLK